MEIILENDILKIQLNLSPSFFNHSFVSIQTEVYFGRKLR